MAKEKLIEVPCKIGTIPSTVWIKAGEPVTVGQYLSVKEHLDARHWTQVRILKVNESGYFFAER